MIIYTHVLKVQTWSHSRIQLQGRLQWLAMGLREKKGEKETEGQSASSTADLPPPTAPVETEHRAAVDEMRLLSDDENARCGLELTSLWT